MSEKRNLIEIFSSIQGEGIYVGYRQIFVRFSGCNLCCAYCDTKTSHDPKDFCLIEQTPGVRDFMRLKNPIDTFKVLEAIRRLAVLPHHSVSITGGEPLCSVDFLEKLLPNLKMKVFLETNGTLPDHLVRIIDFVDIISMDIKMPSIAKSMYWEEHKKFLQIAHRKEVYVKIVVGEETTEDEFWTAVQMVCETDPAIPLVIQPVTPIQGLKAPAPEKILTLQELALQLLSDVRAIPQTHKYMGQL